MTDTDKSDDRSLEILKWLEDFPGDVTCAMQVWYECLSSMGTPAPADITAMEEILAGEGNWMPAGNVRYEKMGIQTSFKRTEKKKTQEPGHIMVQHMFKLNSLQKAPDGRIFKIVLSEVYNLRCFEVKDGNLVGGMIKIHPTSEFAKSLVEI
jgi:hypothetical protein